MSVYLLYIYECIYVSTLIWQMYVWVGDNSFFLTLTEKHSGRVSGAANMRCCFLPDSQMKIMFLLWFLEEEVLFLVGMKIIILEYSLLQQKISLQ